MAGYLAAFLAAVAVSLLAVPQILRFAVARGLLDPSGERKTHGVERPRLGGLGILLGLLAGVLAARLVDQPARWWNADVLGILLGALIMYGVGVTDDLLHDRHTGREGLSPLAKLLLQILAALAPVLVSYNRGGGVLIRGFMMPGDGYVGFPVALQIGLTVFWLVGIANAFNFIDGLDGLAGGVAVIVTTGLALISLGADRARPPEAILALATIGGTIGFLKSNFKPARIFMGDGGALLLGYLLAALSVSGVAKGQALISVGVPMMILALPILNLTQVVVGRMLRGESPMQADRTHLHDRLQDAGWSDLSAVLFIYALTGLCTTAALCLAEMPLAAAGLAALTAALLVLVAARRPRP